jgi:hypothetical protein
MSCELCTDPDGMPCFPQYGVGPHAHGERWETRPLVREQWQTNYLEDPDCPGHGTYWCPHCGDGKPPAPTQQADSNAALLEFEAAAVAFNDCEEEPGSLAHTAAADRYLAARSQMHALLGARSGAAMWDAFMARLNKIKPLSHDRRHMSFLGSIEAYRRIFLEAVDHCPAAYPLTAGHLIDAHLAARSITTDSAGTSNWAYAMVKTLREMLAPSHPSPTPDQGETP